MISQVKEGYVKSDVRNGIETLEFYHPQSNALPAKILEELAKEIHSSAGVCNDIGLKTQVSSIES